MSTPTNRTVNIYINQDKAEASLKKLRAESDKLEKSIRSNEAAGKDVSKELEQLSQKKAKIGEIEAIMSGKMAPTLRMVKQQVTALRNELQHMSADAPGYAAKFEAFKGATAKLKEMEGAIKGVNNQMNASGGGGGFGSMFSGIGGALLGGLGIGTGITMLQGAVTAAKDFIVEGRRMAYELEGVKIAFDRLNEPGLLDELRNATKGTVNDLELMKIAVKADNFKIPLEKLAELLDFARRRAKDTGEEVGYLVESIVLGISRKSIPIMDNLGISAVELQEEFAKTGDFAQAAFNIIQREGAKAGQEVETLSEKQAKLNAEIENFQMRWAGLWNRIGGKFAEEWNRIIDGFKKDFIDLGWMDAPAEEIVDKIKGIYTSYRNADALTRHIIANQVRADRQKLLDEQKKFEQMGLKSAAQAMDAQVKLYDEFLKLYDEFLKKVNTKTVTFSNFTSGDLGGMTKAGLEELKKAGELDLSAMTVNDPKRDITLEKIAAIDKLLAKFKNAKGTEKAEASLEKHQAALLREFEQLQAEVATITQDETQKLTAEQEKQLVAVSNKYLALAEKAKEYKITLAGLTETQEQEITALQQKFAKERAAREYNLQVKELEKFHVKEKAQLLKRLADGEITEKEHFDLTLQMESDHIQDRLTIAGDYAADAEQAEKDAQALRTQALQDGIDERKRREKKGNDGVLAALELNVLTARKGSKAELNARKAFLIEQFEQETAHMDKTSAEYLLKQTQLNDKLNQLDKDFLKEKLQSYIDVAQQIYNAFADIIRLQQQASEAALRNEVSRIEKEQSRYQQLLDEKKISQEVYNKKTEELEEEKRAKEQEHAKKAFEQNKAMSLAQIAISTAAAIMKAWELGPIAGPIAAAAIGVLGIAQAGIVGSQEFPEYAKGGLLEGAGHSEGGIAMIDSRTGRKVGEAEGGEPVLSRATYANNRELVDQLLYSSMYQGGRRLPDWMWSRGASIRMDAYRPGYMANGGYVSTASASRALNLRGGDLPGLDAAAINKFADAVDRFEKMAAKGLTANVYATELERKNKELMAIRDRSRMAG